MMHIDFSYCTNQKEALIFQFTDNDFSSQLRISELLTKSHNDRSHCPLIFIDKSGTKKLPHEGFLSLFTVVLTTTQRLRNEWKDGRFREKFEAGKGRFECPLMTIDPTTQACSLLKMLWTRLIVDIDDAIGGRKANSAIKFASCIPAQRRWVMTGAPTPQTIDQPTLSIMNAMLQLLQHDFFGSRFNGDRFWHSDIVQRWNDGNIVSFFRLKNLIAMFMIRHTKLDIAKLPLPRFTKTYIHLSAQEVKAYNTLVCAVQSNQLLTLMKGNLEGFQNEALSNLIVACSGVARVTTTLTKAEFVRTIDLLISHKADPVDIKFIEDYLHRVFAGALTSCTCCGIQLNIMIVTPCAHLVCTECSTTATGSCPVCKVTFNIDDFELLQPNILYKWAWEIESSNSSRITSFLRALIHGNSVQSAADHGSIRSDVIFSVQRHQPSGGHDCEYDSNTIHGKCLICLEEHKECVKVSVSSRCSRCHIQAETYPDGESKFLYVINKLQALQFAHLSRPLSSKSNSVESLIGEEIAEHKRKKPKVIVISQFQTIMEIFSHRILRRFDTGCVARDWGLSQFRNQEWNKFENSDDCFCILLINSISTKRNLSFVT